LIIRNYCKFLFVCGGGRRFPNHEALGHIISLGKIMYSIRTMGRWDNTPYRRKWVIFLYHGLRIIYWLWKYQKYQYSFWSIESETNSIPVWLFQIIPTKPLKYIQKLYIGHFNYMLNIYINRTNIQIVVVVIVWHLELQLPMQHSIYHQKCLCVWIPLMTNKAPDEPLIQQENFDTDLLDNVNSGHLNEEIYFSITHEKILNWTKRVKK
jgi:hypothetical protein